MTLAPTMVAAAGRRPVSGRADKAQGVLQPQLAAGESRGPVLQTRQGARPLAARKGPESARAAALTRRPNQQWPAPRGLISRQGIRTATSPLTLPTEAIGVAAVPRLERRQVASQRWPNRP